LQDAAVLIEGERIAWVGPRSEARDLHSAFRIPHSAIDVVEVTGVLFPGLVDCHTHAVFGAPRLDDHERRALGEDYKTVAARGGGILESVRDVRARSESELVALMQTRVRALLAHGSTTIEVKSGYGLDPVNELKQLRAIRKTAAAERASLVPTFLGAHEVPPEFRGRRAEAGAAVALATDFNPGSSPTVGLPLVMALGLSQLGLRYSEVVSAVTVNAAAALGLAADRGQIAPGFRADLVCWGVSDWREV